MPKRDDVPIAELHLDLGNYRTVPQSDEIHATNALISINLNKFWALMNSLLDDGFHPTENIILLDCDGKYLVKEGNRRIAALKIIFGLTKGIDIPESTEQRINDISAEWKKENSKVPCTIYKKSESDKVDAIVSLIHAKGEAAGRDPWNAVARARHNRDQKSKAEPGLDLLEKYLENGRNFTPIQSDNWSGDYPLSVLDETISKLSAPLGCSSSKDVAKQYPKKNKRKMDKILHDIGTKNLAFKQIRDKDTFFGTQYGIAPAAGSSTTSTSKPGSTSSKPAVALNDPKSVYQKVKGFKPKGKNREKVVTLLGEMKKLKIDKHPHSFCFLLRSMFEISAKAYCKDHSSSGGPSPIKKDGSDKSLAVLLKDIQKHLTKNNKDKAKVKELHGAITELAKPEGLLSVTSLNQLVHNPKFSIQPNDISILFNNVFPLLEEMNK